MLATIFALTLSAAFPDSPFGINQTDARDVVLLKLDSASSSGVKSDDANVCGDDEFKARLRGGGLVYVGYNNASNSVVYIEIKTKNREEYKRLFNFVKSKSSQYQSSIVDLYYLPFDRWTHEYVFSKNAFSVSFYANLDNENIVYEISIRYDQPTPAEVAACLEKNGPGF